MLTSRDIRQQFIDFFCKRHDHVYVPSSPVVPYNDPTLLFTNAGMNQFKPYFLGTEKPPYKRVANTQKCIRAGGKHNDLDDVGKDTYHHTFFEMLGNWSFGDYFKKEAITWAWELLTEVWQIDPARLHVTVFEGDPENNIPRDEEAARYWRDVGVPAHHIHYGGKKDNFWEMGDTGPCGPCTEIHFDRTADKSGGKLVNAGTDLVIEIWNLVFIQFNRNEDQSLAPLPENHVDTGMGFERICAVLQNKTSNYDTDVFAPLFTAIQQITGAPPYTGGLDNHKDIAYRVIADHIRALTFALTDGAAIGNIGRDYVLRRILRRAERYGVQYLDTREPFLYRLVPILVEQMGDVFPELRRNPQQVQAQIHEEEKAFLRTLHRGIKLFKQIAEETRQSGRDTISGEDAFKLHDTYGLFIDITQQMAAEEGLRVDVQGFENAMQQARIKAREASKKYHMTTISGELPPTDDHYKYLPGSITAQIVGWLQDNQVNTQGVVPQGINLALLLDRTNFYAEQGGQVGDTGYIRSLQGEATFIVEDTQRLGDAVLHIGYLQNGELHVGQEVELTYDLPRRQAIMRNHTATHLLNHALRKVLGSHVEQKGSLVDDTKTRFDFSHDKPLTLEQIRQIEQHVNEIIQADQPVIAVVKPLAVAREIPGVRAVFGEKYPDPVRVVLIGTHSPEHVTLENPAEFCGGTHVAHTGQIGCFKILSQEAVAKGVRRITAITGPAAFDLIQSRAFLLEDLALQLQCRPEEVRERITSLQDQLKKLQEQLKKSSTVDLTALVDKLWADAPLIGSTRLIIAQLPNDVPLEAVRAQVDRLRQKCPSALVVFGWIDSSGKVPLLAAVTPDLVGKGIHAQALVKQLAAIVGGGGGGKADFAQAGGKLPEKLPEALQLAEQLGRNWLNPS
ncbi:alanine--tRNA ligase [Thermogemmata fonticola]|uniref:Alanine--tRNA ligase n=1 Tax=Thermogemmata fonticola TaxID=2755323 RepID=A0A7V9AA09_9BACT|nr:alanine--tRNA ligase [Thermogemmata fonticola]MBA2224616.1 alanine--tRNA ligase [Thermogemmata fonticola]